jgi:wyosine [tRNA(Phe)-imidazoG37] synthetase (radical SAM superfamily)
MRPLDLHERPLREIGLQRSLVYGPVASRRLGRSLGINPLPTDVKVCTYDCLYCQYGLEAPVAGGGRVSPDAFPPAEQILRRLEEAVRGRVGAIDAITFSGNGEPTLHPRFPELVDGAVAVRDRYLPGARIALLSNGTTVTDDRIRDALRRIDDPILKIDAGAGPTWRVVNRPGPAVSFDGIISRLAEMDGIIVQSMFFAGAGEGVRGNSGEAEIAAWLDVVDRVGPRLVQIYTLDRTPAVGALRPVPEPRLREIGAALEDRGVRVCIF